jgi:hypothetical protein
MRTEGICSQCGDEGEIAARGLCFKCYRQRERSLDLDPWTKPDRFAAQLKKAQRKTRKALIAIVDALEGLEDCGLVSEEDVSAMRKIAKPNVDRIGAALAEKKTVTTFPSDTDDGKTQ